MLQQGKVSSDIPKGKKDPSGGKQTSGKTRHARMSTGKKVEGDKPKGMPSC